MLFHMASVLLALSVLWHLLVDICFYVGMAAECQAGRSQIRNKEIAMTVLRSRFVAHSLHCLMTVPRYLFTLM